MDELDQFVKHKLKAKNYFRYADDFIIVHDDPKYLQLLLKRIDEFLRAELLLQLHPQKIEIRKFSQGIDFLGYVVLPHHVVLRTKTKKRMFKKLFSRMELLDSNKLGGNGYNQNLQSYLGMIKHSNGYDLANLVKNTFS